MSQHLKRVGVLSVTKMVTVLYAGLGLLVALVAWVVLLVAPHVGESVTFAGGQTLLRTAGGVGLLIVIPVVYGVIGFIIGGVASWLYNIVAGVTGGVELEIG